MSDNPCTLQELAKQYHDRCDAFDRLVCTGKSPRSGEPLPINGREKGLIGRNARQVNEDIVAQGRCMGFTPRQVEDAIREYEDKKHEHNQRRADC